MPDAERKYYVYILYREDGVTPFYVGMGNGKRWLHHEVRAHLDSSPKSKVIQDLHARGLVLTKRKVAEGFTHQQAQDLERSLIATIGRHPKGPLLNRTSGGQGAPGISEETRQRQSQRQKEIADRPGERERRRERGLRTMSDPKRVAFVAELQRQRMQDPARRAAVSAMFKGKIRSPEHNAKIGASKRGVPRSPEVIAKVAAKRRGMKLSAETRAKMSASRTGRVFSPESRAKMSESAKRWRAERRAALEQPP